MREIVLINITGEDRPGLTAAITGVLLQGGVSILDIGLAVMHGTLSFGILVDIPDNEVATALLQSVQAKAHELNLQARYTPISEADYQHWADGQGEARHIVTLLSRKITPEQLQRVSAVISQYGLTIERIERLSARVALDAETDKGKAAIEISVRGAPSDAQALRADFFALAEALSIDIAFQKDDLFRRNRRLAVFDMDSTLIEVGNVAAALAMFAGRRVRREQRSILLSAARSALFNRVLAARIADGSWNRGLEGEVWTLAGSRSVFGPEPWSEALAERLVDFDIHPSGPLWGQGELRVQSAARSCEETALQGDDAAALRAGLEREGLKQERRSLRLRPDGLAWEWLSTDVLRLGFALPPGSYATAVLHELGSARDASQPQDRPSERD